jgi:hypothetical protein
MPLSYEEARRAARAHPRFPELEARLLSIGGTEVVPLPDPHLGLLLARGQVMDGRPPKKVRGRPSRCHENVSLRYLADPHFRVVTGYGLTADDSLWRQHSWLWTGSRVLETTCLRDIYFGVVLDRVEAAGFVLRVVVDVLPGLDELFQRPRSDGGEAGPSEH